MSNCSASKEDNDNLFNNCMKCIQKYAKGKLLETNLWFHHPRTFDTPEEFKEFDKDLGAQGYMPANLPQVLRKWGIPSASIKYCIAELDLIVKDNRLHTWKTRWEKFNKKLNTKAIKQNIKKELDLENLETLRWDRIEAC